LKPLWLLNLSKSLPSVLVFALIAFAVSASVDSEITDIDTPAGVTSFLHGVITGNLPQKKVEVDLARA